MHNTDIYLAYSGRNTSLLANVVLILSGAGYTVGHGVADLSKEGAAETIKKFILDSKVVVFLLAPDSVRSNLLAFELGIALGGKKRIISVVARHTLSAAIPGPLTNRRVFRKVDLPKESKALLKHLRAEFAAVA